MASITFTISDRAHEPVIVATDADRPQVGRPVTPAESLTLMLLAIARREGAAVEHNPDAVPLVALALDLMSPEGFGHAVPLEVRQRAKRALGPRMAQLVPAHVLDSTGAARVAPRTLEVRLLSEAEPQLIDIDPPPGSCAGCTGQACHRQGRAT